MPPKRKNPLDAVTKWTTTTVSPFARNAPNIVWNAHMGKYVTACDSSSDGITWTDHVQSGVWPLSGDTFVVCIDGLTRTTDGHVWTTIDAPVSQYTDQPVRNGRRGIYSRELDTMVIVTYDNNVLVGKNHGTQWSCDPFIVNPIDETTVAQEFNAVAWAPELRMFCMVGHKQSYTSPDGVTWTAHTNDVTTMYIDTMVWFPDVRKFIGLASQTAFHSSDGITWTAHSTGFDNYLLYQFNHLVAALGYTIDDARFSVDGLTWVSNPLIASNETWTSIAWSPSLKQAIVTHNSAGGGLARARSLK